MPGVFLLGCLLQITIAPTKTQIPLKLLFLLTNLVIISHEVEAGGAMVRWNLIHPSIPLAEAPTSGPSPMAVRWSSSAQNPPLLRSRKNHRKHLAMATISPLGSPDYRSLVASTNPSLMLKKSPTLSPHLIRSPTLGATPPGFSDGSISPAPAQPPVNPPANGCCKPNMVLKRDSADICNCVYPINLELFLQNVSLSTEDWPDKFLKQLSLQLALRVSQFVIGNFYVVGQSGFNITMDITPHKGLSFSDKEVRKINHSLYNHAVHINPALVGSYRVISLTWFKPQASSLAPAVASSPHSSPPASPPKHKATREIINKKHSNIILIVVICVVVVVIVITLMLVYCYVASLRRKKATALDIMKTRSIGSLEGSFHHSGCTRFIAYEELREATNNFDTSSVLGSGGFGRVFKGVLSDGTAVAIKKLTLGGQQGDKEFLVEVEMLSRLHHRNLVKLVGYYSSHESVQNLLCYELVPNGSLENWLHGPLGANCPLNWDTRMKIALDAARGLAYLHEDSQPCVIHRDFKASNILLENDFHAKVADFGLAKQAPEGRGNHISTRVMGTFGYVAPEYAMTGHLLVKSDVYSYGVVLLELLTGKKPVDMSQASGQENLVNWARPILRDKERLDDLIDPRIVGKYPEDDCLRVCTVAAACVAPEASQRPTMGEVVQSLKMVQHTTENQEPNTSSSNIKPSSTINDDNATATSTIFSGPFSSLSLTLVGPKGDGSAVKLKDWIGDNPNAVGSKVVENWGCDLPFLFKVLSVSKALSIQAHPDKQLAAILHAKQPGVYKDANHKPEMAIAITQFNALCGFISLKELKDVFRSVPEIAELVGSEDKDMILAISEDDEIDGDKIKGSLSSIFTRFMAAKSDIISELICRMKSRLSSEDKLRVLTDKERLALELEEQYPDDVGVISSFFFNYVKLNPGEALYIGPNEPHAYLFGECIECMATSDNVVRAGLTPKFRDVPTLCSMLTYKQGFPEILKGVRLNEFTLRYTPPFDEFEVDCCFLPPRESVNFQPVLGPSLFVVLKGDGDVQFGFSKEKDAILEGDVLFVPENIGVTLFAGSSELKVYRAGINESVFQ